MVESKLLIPRNKSRDYHLRDESKGPMMERYELRPKIYLLDGYPPLFTLCGTTLNAKQSVIDRVESSEVCSVCIEEAKREGKKTSHIFKE